MIFEKWLKERNELVKCALETGSVDDWAEVGYYDFVFNMRQQ